MTALRPEENTSVTPGGREEGGESRLHLAKMPLLRMDILYEGTLNSIKRQFNLQHNS